MSRFRRVLVAAARANSFRISTAAMRTRLRFRVIHERSVSGGCWGNTVHFEKGRCVLFVAGSVPLTPTSVRVARRNKVDRVVP
jgi:hypothetical protein